MQDERPQIAGDLMLRFAERTGLVSDEVASRYLWTDAFAVCNFLGLARTTQQERYTELALRLVDRVHHTLGRHREDDLRKGWISGLSEEEGEAHPTRGGLRIGKPLPERCPGEPLDGRQEWDRDGQYFHYLTKWMHALDQLTRSTGDQGFNRWACELARAAHRAFAFLPISGTRKRLYWKMSIDLTRALVPTMGQHDPLDGFVTCVQLDTTRGLPGSDLTPIIEDFAAMLDLRGLATSDPLGIGGLLVDAYRVHQLMQQGTLSSSSVLLDALLTGAATGLCAYVDQPDLRLPATHRLAFRELGLAIGLAAVARLATESPSEAVAVRRTLDALAPFAPVRTEIESFWLQPENRQTASWLDHANINDVMLATSLVPDGFLVLEHVSAS